MNREDKPSLFRKLSTPDKSEIVNARALEFIKEVEVLREKHSIPNMTIVIGLNILDDDGEEINSMLVMQRGDELQNIHLVGMAFGSMQESLTNSLSKSVSRGRKG